MKRPHIWRRAGIAALAVSALALTACSGGNSGGGNSDGGGGDIGDGVVRIGTTTEVVNWTPLNSTYITDIYVTGQMYPQFLTLQSDGSYAPHLADSFDVSEDGSQLTIHLNPDFKWSDGEPITAEDVQFTFDRMRDDRLVSGAGYIANYDSTTVEDEHTAVLNLKQPSFGWALDVTQNAYIIPKHVLESVPNLQEFSLENNPESWVSGGSFTLSNIVPGQRYDLVPNEYYPLRADGNEAVTGLEFKVYPDINTMQLALQNNDIDVMAPVVPASTISNLQSLSNVEVVTADAALNLNKLTFNASRGPLSDPEVRRAISGLIDTNAIVTAVLQGHGATFTGPVIPAFGKFQPDLEPYSSTPEEVKQVLQDAGYPNPTLVLTCDQGNSNHAKTAQLVRDMLQPAGITVDLRCAERATSLAAAKAGDFDLYIHKLGQQNSPGTSLYLQFDPSNPSGLNYNFVDDPVSTKLLAAVRSAPTEGEYVDAVKAAAEHVNEQAYILSLFAEDNNSAFNNSRFTGFQPAAFETTTMIGPWSLAQVVPSA